MKTLKSGYVGKNFSILNNVVDFKRTEEKIEIKGR